MVGESTIDDDGVDEDFIADLLLDYLLNKHQTRVMEKLRERKLIPKVMDEFDVGALLDRSGIKMAGGVGLYVLVPNSDLHQKYP